MKKHLLTAALAIVAVGGVFAMNASTKLTNSTRYEKIGTPQTCHQITCSNVQKAQLCSVNSTLYLNSVAGVCQNPVSDSFIYRAD